MERIVEKMHSFSCAERANAFHTDLRNTCKFHDGTVCKVNCAEKNDATENTVQIFLENMVSNCDRSVKNLLTTITDENLKTHASVQNALHMITSGEDSVKVLSGLQNCIQDPKNDETKMTVENFVGPFETLVGFYGDSPLNYHPRPH